jgi:hypothetical protein
MIGPDNIIDSLNEELLKCTGEQEEKKDEKVAKRNSKQDIINKCIKVAEDTGIPLQYSDTKLNRMTKQELNKLLAANIEAGMQQQMAEQVGVQKNASEKLRRFANDSQSCSKCDGARHQCIFTEIRLRS